MSLNSSSSGGSGCGGNAGGSGCGDGGASSGSPCGACKFLRRKCVAGCIFAPYFDSETGSAHFAAVHKIFGASNVSKLLLNIPSNRRLDAVITICFEAQARLRDPVYGCVGHIFGLQQQVMALQAEITYLQGGHGIPTTELQMPPPPPPPQEAAVPAPVFPASGLPSTTTFTMPLPANFDLSALTDPPPSWAVQQRTMDPRQYLAPGPSPNSTAAFLAMAREFRRHGPAAPGPHGPHGPSSSSSLSKFSK